MISWWAGEGNARIGLPHKALADQESVKAGGAELGDVLGSGDAAFGHAHDFARDADQRFYALFSMFRSTVCRMPPLR